MLVLAMQFSRGSTVMKHDLVRTNTLAEIGEGGAGAHLQNGTEDGTILGICSR
jgi:hypothetical protein